MAAQIPKQKVSVPSSQSTDLSALFVPYLCEQWPSGLSIVPQMYSVFFFFFDTGLFSLIHTHPPQPHVTYAFPSLTLH